MMPDTNVEFELESEPGVGTTVMIIIEEKDLSKILRYIQ